LINKAIEINPKNPRYYLSIAEIWYSEENIEEAIKAMKKCVSLRPTNINYLLGIAALYEEI
jgi:cytochrome c-type biogenesis protein CcmH/NrfG